MKDTIIMKDTFHIWNKVNTLDLDTLTDLIRTGKTTSSVEALIGLCSHLGNPIDKLNILDFGCGIGINIFEFAKHAPNWTLTGYDNINMLSRIPEYKNLRYKEDIFTNIFFKSDWDEIKNQKFDVILCSLVLQHINENDISIYIRDFKNMTHKIVVAGRRYNDDGLDKSVWNILEKNGLVPTEFYGQTLITLVPYTSNGNSEDHNLAIYNI